MGKSADMANKVALLALTLIFVGASAAGEVQDLGESDPLARLCEGKEGDCPHGKAQKALQKAISSGGDSTAIADAKAAVTAITPPSHDKVAKAAVKKIEKITQKAAEAIQAVMDKVAAKAKKEQKKKRRKNRSKPENRRKQPKRRWMMLK